MKPGMMNGLPMASLSHVQTYDQFDQSAWPTVKNEKHFLMVPRRGGGGGVNIRRNGGFDWFGQKRVELQTTS